MRKFIASIVMMALMAVMVPLFATEASAQKRYNRKRTETSRSYERPNIYQRHRNIINVGIGTAAGAVLGGLLGGKKGAGWGALAGAGAGAAYTYKIKPKQRRY